MSARYRAIVIATEQPRTSAMAAKIADSSGIRLRVRPDLIVQRKQSADRGKWIVKDPVSLRYYAFSAQEFAILKWLDGTRSLADLQREFEEEFPPSRISQSRLQGFLADLYESGLVLAEGPDHGQLLLDRSTRQQQRERWQQWTNVLAFKFRGIDPDRLLTRIYPYLRWCFSRWFLVAYFVSLLAALLIAAVHLSEIGRQLPELHELLNASNLLWLTAAFVIAKILHEFGHALVCKHYGGECHEMGLMMLVFAPVLYCNVTDSWMLQSRWQRIAVSAAGILVEIQLAALAVFLWFYSQPSVVHAVALNLLVVCSFGTVLFNGNPLLRYDGYFVLADLLEIPNLWHESRTALKGLLARWFLKGNVPRPSAPDASRGILIAYGIASLVYRAILMAAILLFLQRLLVPRGFGFLVPVMIAGLVATASVSSLAALRRFCANPMAWRRFRPIRLLTAAGLAVLGVWTFFCISFPCQISAPALLQPLDAHRVYVSTPGTLISCVSSGDAVIAGQPLAHLDDAKLMREIEQLRCELQIAQTRLKNLQARLNDEPSLAAQLEVAEEMAAEVKKRLSQREEDAQALTLKAPAPGWIMQPPERSSHPFSDQILPTWTGTPLESRNSKCFLDRGTLFCLVGDPARQEAVIFVDESDVRYVRVGQTVRLQFPIAPATILSGHVVEISKRNMATVPYELAADERPANTPDASGARRPLHASYTIRVSLDEHDAPLLTAASGRAKIAIEPEPLAERLLRVLRRTFTVPM